jgi:AraC-like DNA-binding protein
MDGLTAFGLLAVTAMPVTYAVEDRSPWFILAFAGACALGSVYGFLQGAWPFGLGEAIWALVAARRWWLRDSGLVELAAIAGLSPHHFVGAFKISVGKPPHRFVMERRVQRAVELLRDGNRTIAEIANAAGFSSQSHLTANFRRVTGLTPGRFRRSLS